MISYLIRILRTYAPVTMLPFACVVGAIGYSIESFYRDTNPPYFESVQQRREERLMEELGTTKPNDFPSLKEKNFVPKTVFDINLSPNLLQHEKEN